MDDSSSNSTSSIHQVSPDSGLVLFIGHSPTNRIAESHLTLEPLKGEHFQEPFTSNETIIWRRIEYRALTADTVNDLVPTIDRVSHFAVILDQVPIEQRQPVIYLLRSLPLLKSLHFHVCFSSDVRQPDVTYAFHHLMGVIHTLANLKTLYFELEGYVYGHGANPPSLKLSVLRRLEHFTFFSFDDASMLAESLKEYVSIGENGCPMPVVTVGNPITHNFVGIVKEIPALSMTNLMWLYLDKQPLNILASTLAPLTSLAVLKLVIDFREQPPFKAESPTKIVSLSSVTRMTLLLMTTSADNFDCGHLGVIFPNLAILRIFVTSELADGYRRQLLKPWREQCSKLEQLSVSGIKEIEESIESEKLKQQEEMQLAATKKKVDAPVCKKIKITSEGDVVTTKIRTPVKPPSPPLVLNAPKTPVDWMDEKGRDLNNNHKRVVTSPLAKSNSSSGSSSRLRVRRAESTCRNCGSNRHLSRECSKIRCYNCEKTGHPEYDCPELK